MRPRPHATTAASHQPGAGRARRTPRRARRRVPMAIMTAPSATSTYAGPAYQSINCGRTRTAPPSGRCRPGPLSPPSSTASASRRSRPVPRCRSRSVRTPRWSSRPPPVDDGEGRRRRGEDRRSTRGPSQQRGPAFTVSTDGRGRPDPAVPPAAPRAAGARRGQEETNSSAMMENTARVSGWASPIVCASVDLGTPVSGLEPLVVRRCCSRGSSRLVLAVTGRP